MTIYINRPGYSNRYEAQRSLDFAPGIDVNSAIDRATISAAENIDGQMKRVFYPSDDTRYYDWPNQGGTSGGQYADPWRLWLDDDDLVCLTALVTGGVTIPLDQVFLMQYSNPRKGIPCYPGIELDRSSNAAFGGNAQTPQYSIALTSTWGYGADADYASTLAADVGDDDTTVTVSDGSTAAPGDLIVLGYGRGDAPFPGSDPHAGAIQPYTGERVLITDVSAADTGLAQTGSGVTTAEDNDIALQWTGSGSLNAGEVIVLDQEQMLVEQIVNSIATVRRAYGGTMLATHSDAEIYAMREFSVLRGLLGTTASTYSSGADVYRHRVPQLIRDVSIAEVENQLMQEGCAYARTVGSGEGERPAPGAGLADKWGEARTRHGRKGRIRGV